jgi:membrane carboxypeptidase/penicillin-binding protein
LAGVQKNPSRYNPLGKPVNVTGRRDVVLKRMEDLGIISSRQRQALRANPASVVKPGQAPQYLAHVRNKLIERYGAEIVEQGGLEVTAALDLNLQKQAEQALRDGVKRISPEMQGALISLDIATGDVLAAVGGTDGQAVLTVLLPGIHPSPLIYAAALSRAHCRQSLE